MSKAKPKSVHDIKEAEFWFITGLPKMGKSFLARKIVSGQARVLVYDPTSTIQGRPKGDKRIDAFDGLTTEEFSDVQGFIKQQAATRSGFRIGFIDQDVEFFDAWLKLILKMQTVPASESPEFPLIIWIEEAALAMPEHTTNPHPALAKIIRLRQHLRISVIITTQYAEDTPRIIRKQSEVFVTFRQVSGENIKAIKEKGIGAQWLETIPTLSKGSHLIQRGASIKTFNANIRPPAL